MVKILESFTITKNIGKNNPMKGFLNFIREQGVMGLAVGFILGGAISKLVTSIVTDLLNPLLSLLLGRVSNLKDAYLQIGNSKLLWGDFLNTFIDFMVICFVVYVGFKLLRLETIDKKKA